jgi:hypothetical protein
VGTAMQLHSALFSRRSQATVDFRPADPAGDSPFAQLLRLSAYLKGGAISSDSITDCGPALDYLREYTYRKVFTNTTHEQFVALDQSDPAAIDWLLAVHGAETDAFQSRKNSR